MIITLKMIKEFLPKDFHIWFKKTHYYGLDVSDLWDINKRAAFWEKALKDNFMKGFVGPAIEAGLIPNKIEGNFSGYNLKMARLFHTNMSGVNLNGANLKGASLRCANLSTTNLSNANLVVCDLEGADLFSANLRGVNLSMSYLYGSNLTKADLTGANLGGVKYDKFTRWPEGFDKKRRLTGKGV